MRVLKFGGSSVASAERMGAVARIVAAARERGPVAVVVSALGGVTDGLLAAAAHAAARETAWEGGWAALRDRHLAAAAAVAPPAEAEGLATRLAERFADLHDLLHGAFLLRECSPRTRDAVVSFGERCAAELVAGALRRRGLAAEALDARRAIVTDDAFGRARVDTEATFPRLREAVAAATGVPVVTGFIGATARGETTTLGRGGSDLTASLVGAALGAEAVELWTDVSGVMSADPRLVPDAFPLPRLSYAELMELSHFGAKVVHPPSVHPARRHGVPLLIKNTLDPAAEGTLVLEEGVANAFPVRGIASIHRVALMRLEGDGMVGVPGIAMRLFGALARRGVSVILISQGSSEHSICFAVAPEDAEAARAAAEEEFALERRVGLVEPLVVDLDQSVVAAVGEGMRERPGLAARLFGALGGRGVNVRAIAQGSSELNVSLVVAAADERAAVTAIHGTFFHPRRRRVQVAVLGCGRVGGEVLDRLAALAPRVAADRDLELVVVAAGGSRRALVEPEGVRLAAWREDLAASPERPEGDAAAAVLAAAAAPGGFARLFVDCTASESAAAWYRQLLAAGVGVVAANKRPFAGPAEDLAALLEEAAARRLPLRFGATVGAGLPVVSTIEALAAAGDAPTSIAGVLSGTLGELAERLRAGEAASAAVAAAHAAGLTEPHPWDDLSGEDVRRKLVILARLAGASLETGDVEVEPFLPGDGWAGLPLEELWHRLPQADEALASRQAEAAARGERLRYLASWGAGGARVALAGVGPEHPAFALAGPDNQVAIGSRDYAARPLVVQGPGAGPAVTAGGVLADLLRAAAEMGG